MAFDHYARCLVARAAKGTSIQVHKNEFVIDEGVKALPLVCSNKRQLNRWLDRVSEARGEVKRFANGSGDFERLASLVQYLARVELVYRCRWFDPQFRPDKWVAEEIIAMGQTFGERFVLPKKGVCVLNPNFVASMKVGAADADLVLNDTLIDFKTTVHPRVTLTNRLQLAGYASLQRIGGIPINDRVHAIEFKKVGLYLARYGEFVCWDLSDIFPNGNFDRFHEVFLSEITRDDLIKAERERQLLKRKQREAREEAEQARQIAKWEEWRRRQAKIETVWGMNSPRELLREYFRLKGELFNSENEWLSRAFFTAITGMVRRYPTGRFKLRRYKTRREELEAIASFEGPVEMLRSLRRNWQIISARSKRGDTLRLSLETAARRLARKKT